MFDAKSILESLVTGGQRGGASLSGRQGDPLGDLLGGGGGGLGDLLRNALPKSEGAGSSGPQGDPLRDIFGKLGGSGARGSGDAGGGGFNLDDLLGKLGGSGKEAGGSKSGSGSSITDVLGDLLKQAKEGTQEGARRVDEATGASDKLGDLARQLSGKSPEELLQSLKDLIAENKLGTGAALGGLGALILGTETGRSIAVSAAKLGALALIGGLAYKAYQNYQKGASADAAASGGIELPPSGSGFEPDAVSNDDAMLMIRTMIAAAAADGRIDASEQKRILSNLQEDGGDLGPGAEEFLASELNTPASAAEIAAAVSSKEQAAQVYAAARIAIDPDTRGERTFLNDLANRLGLEPELAQYINAAARGA